jgi:alpha-tubulin suppressor-like RCC1 family protein
MTSTYGWLARLMVLTGLLVFGTGYIGAGTAEAAIVPQVSSGYSHTVALKNDGTVWAWGLNSSYQLGDGTSTQRLTPVKVNGISDVASVVAGYYHTIALKNNGTVWGWGSNNTGQLGNGTTGVQTTPSQTSNLSGVIAVSTGIYHSLALKNDGTVWAWGYNTVGQLGDGTTTQRLIPVQVSGLTGIIAIASGVNHNLALKSDGSVWAWGDNSVKQLGDGTTTQRLLPVQVSGLSGVTEIASGCYHSFALKSDGSAWSWGYNNTGQLGYATTGSSPAIPAQITGLNGVISLTGGNDHSVALQNDGTVWAWGVNVSGHLGDGTVTNRTSPAQVIGLNGVTSIASGISHTLAIRNDNTIWGWGSNTYGQLGDGTTTQQKVPKQLSGLSAASSITASKDASSYTSILKSDGTVWSWGYNTYGQLGDGTTVSRLTPAQVSNLSGVTAIASGIYHTIVQKNDGTVWSWGYGSWGALGDGTATSRPTPVQVNGLSGITAVSVGAMHSLALRNDGTVWAWGWNGVGQIGDGTTTQRYTPIQINGLTGITAIATGYDHSLALRNDGTVWAWGSNTSGYLGDGTTTNRLSPVQITSLTGVVAIAAGSAHSMALMNDGTVWAWGNNGYGQLGDGSFIQRLVPVQVSGLNGISTIISGSYHSFAVKNDGTFWGWGINDSGQLADGSTIRRAAPVQANGLSGIIALAAGFANSYAVKSDGTVLGWGENSAGQLGEKPYIHQAIIDLIAVTISGTPSTSLGQDAYYAFVPTSFGATSFSITNKPAWATFDAATGSLYGTPTAANIGVYPNIIISATDGIRSASLPAFSITVYGQPIIGGTPAATATAGLFYSFTPTSTNAGSFGISGKPGWASFNTSTGTLSGTPTVSNIGVYSGIGILAINGGLSASLPAFSITVSGPPQNISASAGPGGTISGPSSVNYGGSATYSITPGSGYHIATVLVDGINAGATGSYTFNNVTTAHTISATFAINTYAITLSPGAGGTISGAATVNYGGSATYTVTPTTGYHVATVLVDGLSAGAVTSYTFSNVTATHTISATFAINVYAITATAGTGGTVSGPSQVNYGTTSTYTITPSTGYHVVDVLVDGVSKGAVTTYTLTNVMSTHSISATFALNSYPATLTIVGPGTVSGPTTVTHGSMPTFTITSGILRTVTINGIQIITNPGNFSVQSPVTGALAIVVNFSVPMTVSGSDCAISGPTLLSAGQNATYSIIPYTGYHIVDVMVDGVSAGAVSTYTFTNVTTAHSINVTTAINSYTISANPGSGGSISGAAVVAYGEQPAYAIVPDTGYHTVDVLTDGISAGALPNYTFKSSVKAVSANGYTTVAVKDDGSVWVWGQSNYGQLGNGSLVAKATKPVQVPGLSGIKAVAAGQDFILALHQNGTVWGWGGSSAGQLAGGISISVVAAPTQITGLPLIKAIAAGSNHSAAIDTNGNVWTWGFNGYGQIGDNSSNNNRYSPYQVPGLSGITAIAAGTYNTLALDSSGAVWAWGSNYLGQIGTGGVAAQNNLNPVKINGLTNITSISVGGFNCAALDTNGLVWAWGSNVSGTLGNGSTSNSANPTPIQVPNLTGVISIASGDGYHVALKNNGQVWSWGYGYYGQLANGMFGGPTANSATPVQASNVESVIGMSSGAYHTVAIKSDGSLMGWGSNNFGEIGFGTYGNPIAIPQAVVASGLTGVMANHSIATTFSLDSFTITATAGSNGTISPPSGATTYGNTVTYTITPNTGYHVADVLVDGGSVGAVTTYTFTNLSSNHTIAVSFAINTYTISLNAGPNGTITGPTSLVYGAGDTPFDITPATGYHVVDVTVNGIPAGAVTSFTLRAGFNADATISATFAINAYTVTLSAGANGSISGPTAVTYGDKPSYTITPATGYHIVDVTVNGTSVGAVSSYTFTIGITANAAVAASFAIDSFTLTATAGANGTVTGPASATYGGSASYSITPVTGYHVVDVLVDGVSKGAVASYTITNITANHTISATFAINAYTVAISAGANGSINGPTAVTYGDKPSYTITSATGYHIVDVTVNGTSVGAVSSYTFTTGIIANATLAASFAIDSFTLTATAGANGTVTGPASATYGGSASYSIIPATGYHVVDVLVDGVSKGAVASYTITNITANHTISATFAINAYTVAISAGANGTITGPANVTYGDKPSYTITPATGYHIVDVTVNGTSVGAVSSYTFTTGITANATVAATFAIDSFTLTATSGANGTVNGPASATYGGSATYAITPAIGYHVTDVLVDGVSKGAVASYTITNVTANHTISATFAINAYTVAISAGANGTIAGPANVTYGDKPIYTITPATGYHIVDVTVNGTSVGAVSNYTFTTGITANATLAASFAIDSFTLTATAGVNGAVTGPASATYGGSATYAITPAIGYHVTDVLVDGVSKGAVASYTITNITANHTISATFAINAYTVAISAGANGTIAGPANVTYGDKPSYTITPATGYHIVDVTVNGTSVGAVSSYTFTTGITANATVAATFAIDSFTLTATAGANGTVTGPASATYGGNASYSIIPATGYHVVDVLVDGVSKGAVASYTITNITTNHTISATFAINAYTVAISAGANGSISGPTAVTYGDKPSYTITPATGYHIVDVTVNGTSVGAVSSYTFTIGITANAAVAASFAIDSFTLTATAGANGTVTGPASATYGGSASYTITPAIGYHVVDVQVDGVSKGAVASYTITNITANHTISATFAINAYTVAISAGANGTITGPANVTYGDKPSYTITPATGYHIVDVTVNGTSVGAVSSYTFTTGITANATVAASFAIDSFTLTATAGANGTVTGPASATYGGSASYSIIPATGYHVVDVLVDGVSKGAVASYTITNITANHTISATFAINAYTVAISAGANGSISGPTVVTYGGSATYSITANSGYTLSSVLVDGVSVGAMSSYTFSNVTANHTISATFAAIPTLSITTATLTDGYLTTTYSQTLAATGGTTPYSWTISSGTLPTGLLLATSTGIISGTPTAAGAKTFTVQAKDANGATTTKSLTITAYALPTVSTSSLAGGKVNTSYSQTLAASGGKTAYVWNISSGTLPAGLTLSSAGDISGTPTTAGTVTFTVKVTDANGKTATKSLSIAVTASSKADLVVTAVSGPGSITRGSTKYTFSVTVKNQGTGGSAASKLSFYLSTSSTVSTTTGSTNFLVGSISLDALAAGESESKSYTVSIPSSVTAGSYYIGAYADSSNTVGETSETNNGKSTSSKITVK